jgi:hypothetical protein
MLNSYIVFHFVGIRVHSAGFDASRYRWDSTSDTSGTATFGDSSHWTAPFGASYWTATSAPPISSSRGSRGAYCSDRNTFFSPR